MEDASNDVMRSMMAIILNSFSGNTNLMNWTNRAGTDVIIYPFGNATFRTYNSPFNLYKPSKRFFVEVSLDYWSSTHTAATLITIGDYQSKKLFQYN